jgi:UDP-N-acetylmuramoylalanine--D-glutamate ligase
MLVLLIDVVRQYVRAVVLIGKDKDIIAEALKTVNVPKFSVETIENAVSIAAEVSQIGDAVLLSPACASFDMFDNYEHRGHVFKTEVLRLGNEATKAVIDEVVL